MQRPVGTAQAVTGSVFYAEIQMIFGTVCSTFFTDQINQNLYSTSHSFVFKYSAMHEARHIPLHLLQPVFMRRF